MSQILDEDENYSYEILQEKHLEESTRVLADTFTKYNPLEVYLETTYEQFYPYAFALSKSVLNDQLSVVAVHKETKEIHGLVQAGDAKKLEEQSCKDSDPSVDRLEDLGPSIDTLEVLEEVERRFMKQYGELKENQLVQIMMAGVRPDCSGKGLATKLQQILLAHCGQRGFKHAIVETTNQATYHIYTKKLNGKEFTSIYLPTFVSSDGRRPFEHYDAELQLIVFDLQ